MVKGEPTKRPRRSQPVRTPVLDGRALRARREALGLTQLELAILTGCQVDGISQYENGHLDPSLRAYAAILRALNLPAPPLLKLA